MYVCMCIYNNKVFSSFDLKDDVQMGNRAHKNHKVAGSK